MLFDEPFMEDEPFIELALDPAGVAVVAAGLCFFGAGFAAI
jgi:hypothetical protein